jgi:hypothetical protein
MNRPYTGAGLHSSGMLKGFSILTRDNGPQLSSFNWSFPDADSFQDSV